MTVKQKIKKSIARGSPVNLNEDCWYYVEKSGVVIIQWYDDADFQRRHARIKIPKKHFIELGKHYDSSN